MIVNKELNLKYYNDYVPCDCEVCQNYYLQIKDVYPDICEFLEGIGVDPLKPFELLWDEEGDYFVYFGCQYLSFGDIQENYKNVIEGIEITQNKYFHPSTGREEEHFILDFGTIKLKNIIRRKVND